MGRGQKFANRWGQVRVGNPKPPRYSQLETVALMNRIIRRANKAAGYQTDKPTRRWQYICGGEDCDVVGEVEALTRSEARAAIKAELGIPKKKRVPKGTLIMEIT